ncbi:MAG: glycosyltransferase family 4 protein [Candidatus Eisenbacteria bacterium]|nr:glycosyltransferase family 4 protein [Candidatus Eisenbacteria bacterium]
MTRPEVLLDVFAALYPAGGIGRYVRDLMEALASRPDSPPVGFAYPRHLTGAEPPAYPAERLRPLPFGARRMRALFLASARLGVRPDAWYGRPAVFHSPVGHGPLFGKARLLLTIHDLTFLSHPEWHPFRTRFLLRHTVPAAVRHADRVLCDSEHVRGQVIRELGADPARVETVPLAVDPGFRPLPREAAAAHVADRFGLDGEFVLHVGTVEPRKNHVGLVAAFERLRRAGFMGRLVLVGHDGWHVEPILARLASSSDAVALVRVRDGDDEDLAALYNACTMFVFPSLDEGFGLPLLEAMACGAACLTSDRSSLLEVAAGGAALVDPGDVDALATAMIALWRDPDHRAALGAAGVARAAAFGRDRWVERMFEVYRALLAAGPR